MCMCVCVCVGGCECARARVCVFMRPCVRKCVSVCVRARLLANLPFFTDGKEAMQASFRIRLHVIHKPILLQKDAQLQEPFYNQTEI